MRILHIVLLGLFAASVSACGYKASLITPTQAAQAAAKSERKKAQMIEEKAQREKVEQAPKQEQELQ